MFGLDDHVASLSDGASLVVVLAVAVLLGLRHATDPDHLAALTTLIASGRERRARAAARLGVAWGCGHAVTLFALGIPIVLYAAYLPDSLQRAAETAVGFLIAGLAVWLLVRWRRGAFHAHEHAHEERRHTHLHSHARAGEHRHVWSPLGAFAVGLLHGVGGSAGVGIFIVSTIDGRATALGAAVAVGLWAASLKSDLDSERDARRAEARAIALLASDAERRPLSGGRGALLIAADGSAALVTCNLATAPAGKAYEAWVIADNTPQPAGLFRGADDCDVKLLTREVPRDATVAVTLEREDGVDSPTSQPLFAARPA